MMHFELIFLIDTSYIIYLPKSRMILVKPNFMYHLNNLIQFMQEINDEFHSYLCRRVQK